MNKKYNSNNYKHEIYELNCDCFSAVKLDSKVDMSQGFIINDERPGWPVKDLPKTWSMICNPKWLEDFFSKAVAIVPIYYTTLPSERNYQFIEIYGPSPFRGEHNKRAWWKILVNVCRDDDYDRPSFRMGRRPITDYNPMAYWKWRFGDDNM